MDAKSKSAGPVESRGPRAQRACAVAFVVAALGLSLAACTDNGNQAPADFAIPCDGHACIPGGCDTDNDCRVGQVCDTSTFTCVECLTSAQCRMGFVCHPSSHVCLEGCGPGRACSDGGVCESDAGFCTECLSNSDCGGANPVCDPARNRCAPCLPTDDRCPALSYCVPQGFGFACKPGCKDDRECALGPAPGDGGAGPDMAVPDGGVGFATNYCESKSRACVECLDDTHCPLGKVCVANHCADGCNNQHGCPDPMTQVCCTGQCANLKTDPQNCGACDSPCRPGFQCCAGACSDPSGDVANCGSCGVTCMAPNGTPLCSGGTCKVGQCDPGRGDCNRSIADGCETDIASNVLACGACGQPCSIDNARPVCAGGKCQIGTCFAPFDDCDKVLANGCEAKLDADPLHCGGCANTCSSNHVPTRTCMSSQCAGACEGGWADCNGDKLTDGCETNVATNVMSCGGCGVVCSSVNGTPSCLPMVGCQIMCAPLYGDCDKDVKTGCERNLRTLTDCGACGVACTQANAVPTCNGGTCQILVCNAGWSDCDKSALNGCEAQTDTDAKNCGACGNACSSVNGTPGCAAGRCLITCLGGFADCNRNSADGCEVDTRTDLRNCGACNAACALPHVATNTCTNGACGVSACQAGWADCNGLAADGCEVDVTGDANNCSACNKACSRNHDTPACVASACVLTCNAGYADCKNGVTDGCETQVASDALNCGACNAACALPHVTTNGCANSACTIVQCQAGWADCNGAAADGCEVNTTNDPNHCAGCGKACSRNHDTPACTNSACVLSCDAGWQSCDGDLTNGCETSTASDAANCGGCGTACSNTGITPLCVGGNCVGACAPGFTDCNNDKRADGCEVQTATDKNNCGGCGAACPSQNGTASCASGACRITCNAGFADCDGNLASGCETNTNTSTANCGGCGRACSAANGTPSCVNGACAIACKAGFGNCDGDATNGCETALTSLTNCGACGTVCGPVANGGATCQTGTCAILACNGGFADCNNTVSDGCETNTNADKNNCGGCGVACSAVNGVATCSGGRCNVACNAGFADCNGNPGDGCETAVATDANNCGACGVRCSANNVPTPTCAAGLCKGSCSAGFADCNGNMQIDGCETSLNTDTKNCGGCGAVCNLPNVAFATCTAGTCGGACATGYADCDNNKVTNGCEVDTTRDSQNCGSCGTKCSTPLNALGASCVASHCQAICLPGFGDCDGQFLNGCEVSTLSDPNNCGPGGVNGVGCGIVCSGKNVSKSCSMGACNGMCAPGYDDCNNDKRSDGCETQINGTDVTNCGGCGVVCSSQNIMNACVGGSCNTGTCTAPFLDCNNNKQTDGCEINPQTNVNNCGSCGTVCSSQNITRACAAGSCQSGVCTAPFLDCNNNKQTDGCETNPQTNVNNCGSCGTVCSSQNITRACAAGSCQSGVCTAPFLDCNNNKQTDGCEINPQTDVNNCGACGTVCSSQNITRACAGGSCSTGVCSGVFLDCNNNKQTDGCETNPQTDANNCGACSSVCSSNNMATRTCTAGSCSGTCNAGFTDCDGTKLTNGCEVQTATDANNCGGCGMGFVCSSKNMATRTCTTGACSGTCTAGFADCNNNKLSDGCETNTTSNFKFCGNCSTACTTGKLCVAAACTNVGATMCQTSVDAQSQDPWVLCAYTAGMTAWVSATASGVFHAGQICKQLGFATVAAYGLNGNHICGSPADVVATSCASPGTQAFDNMGSQGVDADGPVLSGSATWKCIP